MILTGRKLAELGELLHGPRWRRWLADKLDKSERTIIRYEDGESNMPGTTRAALLAVVRDQIAELQKWEANLSGQV